MREKLLDLMKNEGLKPSQLAEMLEINPAGISHMLAGRNKPGFDLLQKILKRFPRISPDWLLLDSGPIYRSDTGTSANTTDNRSPETQPNNQTPGAGRVVNTGLFGSPPITHTTPSTASSSTSDPIAPPLEAFTARHGSAVERVVIFYEDQTFTSYSPAKR